MMDVCFIVCVCTEIGWQWSVHVHESLFQYCVSIPMYVLYSTVYPYLCMCL